MTSGSEILATIANKGPFTSRDIKHALALFAGIDPDQIKGALIYSAINKIAFLADGLIVINQGEYQFEPNMVRPVKVPGCDNNPFKNPSAPVEIIWRSTTLPQPAIKSQWPTFQEPKEPTSLLKLQHQLAKIGVFALFEKQAPYNYNQFPGGGGSGSGEHHAVIPVVNAAMQPLGSIGLTTLKI